MALLSISLEAPMPDEQIRSAYNKIAQDLQRNRETEYYHGMFRDFGEKYCPEDREASAMFQADLHLLVRRVADDATANMQKHMAGLMALVSNPVQIVLPTELKQT